MICTDSGLTVVSVDKVLSVTWPRTLSGVVERWINRMGCVAVVCCIHTHTYTHTHICTHSPVYTRTRTKIHTQTHTPTHLHTRTHSHTLTHTHTLSCNSGRLSALALHVPTQWYLQFQSLFTRNLDESCSINKGWTECFYYPSNHCHPNYYDKQSVDQSGGKPS